MDESAREQRVLRTLVDVTDESGGSVGATRIAESMRCDPATVRSVLDSLRGYEFVKITDDGRYQPTVTGREFLRLDIDEGSFVVIDTSQDRSSS